MNSRLLILALIALAAGAATAWRTTSYAPVPQSGDIAVTGTASVGGPFSLVDQTGKRVTDASFRGRYLLVFFGYTYCPDVCPSSLQVIAAALDKLGTQAEVIQPVLITLDPERDTPEKMAAYVKSFHPRLIGLTGTLKEIEQVTKTYRVYAKKVTDPAHPADYTLDHSSIVYLMDPAGRLVTFSTEITKPDALAQQLERAVQSRNRDMSLSKS